jgi:hypothetical protein
MANDKTASEARNGRGEFSKSGSSSKKTKLTDKQAALIIYNNDQATQAEYDWANAVIEKLGMTQDEATAEAAKMYQ